MSFRRKTYPEITDQLLNRLLGGVSGESHAYPPAGAREPFSHLLLNAPAAQITSVYGLFNGGSAQFTKDADYSLSRDGTKLVWKENGRRPDAGSVVEINYLPKRRESRVNDLYPGSVVRTLMEAIALETAGMYAQMETVYRSGFIDTAEGGALDHVVSILGVQRVKAGRNSAELEFSRNRNSKGEITIPAGTRVLTDDGEIEYETVAELVLSDGQPSGRVTARDLLETNDGLAGLSLNLLAKSITGIESVTNPAPSTRLDRDETDAELRTRAKSFLTASEQGTKGAIEAAVAGQGLLVDIDDGQPGLIKVLVHDDQLGNEQKQRLEASVKEVRPAGIATEFIYGPQPQSVDLELRLTTVAGLQAPELKGIQQSVRDAISDYFSKLETKAAGSVSKLIGLGMRVDGVEDVSLVAASVNGLDVLDPVKGELAIADQPTRLGSLSIVDPALATLLTLLVRYPNNVQLPNQTAIQTALQTAVSYLNDLSTQSGVAAQKRTLSWGKLALATVLPDTSPVPLASYDADPGSYSLPDTALLAPYDLKFVFTRPSGVSQIIDSETAAPLILGDFERLSLSKVTVEVKPKGAAL
ncbi:MAG: hypothetical protein P8X63_01200 [Desulfuromonadaceae bacterium]